MSKFLVILEQRTPPFHFALSLSNYVDGTDSDLFNLSKLQFRYLLATRGPEVNNCANTLTLGF